MQGETALLMAVAMRHDVLVSKLVQGGAGLHVTDAIVSTSLCFKFSHFPQQP